MGGRGPELTHKLVLSFNPKTGCSGGGKEKFRLDVDHRGLGDGTPSREGLRRGGDVTTGHGGDY